MASAGNAFANFGAGFLGGYRDILAMKMKEDSQSKRDEALANRQMNLEKLRQEFEGTQRAEDRGLRQQEITNTKDYHTQQLGLQEKQLAAQQESNRAARGAAAQARADAQELKRMQFEFQRDMATGVYDVTKAKNTLEAQQQISDAFAKRYEKSPLAPGESQEDKEAKLALIKSMGITDVDQLSKMTSKEGTVAFVRDVSKKSVEETNKLLDEYNSQGKEGQEAKISYATNSLGYRGVSKDGPVDSFIKETRRASDVAANLGISPVGKDKPPPRSAPDLSQRLTADQLRTAAVGLTNGDKDTTDLVNMYKKENPAVYDQIMRIKQGVDKERELSEQKGLLKRTQYEVW